eukprot:3178613-Alexandrium_andersonii.AAC.1
MPARPASAPDVNAPLSQRWTVGSSYGVAALHKGAKNWGLAPATSLSFGCENWNTTNTGR